MCENAGGVAGTFKLSDSSDPVKGTGDGFCKILCSPPRRINVDRNEKTQARPLRFAHVWRDRRDRDEGASVQEGMLCSMRVRVCSTSALPSSVSSNWDGVRL